MNRKRISRKKFLKAIGGPCQHTFEEHFAWGAILVWKVGDKLYEEHQPDIGPITRYERVFNNAKS